MKRLRTVRAWTGIEDGLFMMLDDECFPCLFRTKKEASEYFGLGNVVEVVITPKPTRRKRK